MRKLIWFCAALVTSQTVLATEWGSIEVLSDGNTLYFDIVANAIVVSATPSTLHMYTKTSIMGVAPNQEEFRVVFNTQDGDILESPTVLPIGIPDFDRWQDGAASDFTLTDLGGGSWHFAGSIANGTQPYQPGNSLGELRLDTPGDTLLYSGLPIGALPEPAMALTKKSSTGRVTTVGQMVHYDYEVFNTGTVVLHNVAVEDDNVDAPPECAFNGNDELAPEGEAGDSVKCTAQRTVTQQVIDLGGTLDNTATATSDETQPVQASLSLPFAVFADSFESLPNVITPVDIDGWDSSIAIGAEGYPVIAYHDPAAAALKVARCTSVLCVAFSVAVVDDLNDTGWYPSIAIGLDGLPVISYYDQSVGALKVIQCNDPACKFGDETSSVVDDEGGAYSSLAIGNDGFPVISYYDVTGKLRVAKCNDAACVGGNETITTVNDSDSFTGLHTSIAIGADGFPVISYQQTVPPSTSTLRVLKCNDAACVGEDETITVIEDTFIVMFESTSITIGADDLPLVTFYDSQEAAIKVVKCNDDACAGNDEIISIVAPLVQGSGRISLTIGDDELPILSYAGLRTAKCNDAACADSDEILAIVEKAEGGGSSSIAIGSDGLPVISYWRDGLRLVHCGTPSCQ